MRCSLEDDRSRTRSLDPIPATRGVTLNWMASFYDRVCRIMGLGSAFREHTVRIAALRSGESVLDVGCGTGVLTRLAAKAVAPAGTTWGIDPAADMIRVALANAAVESSSTRFKTGVIEALAFENESFDAVFASFMLHHLPPDVKRAGLREVRRILKPGGRLVVVDLDRPRNPLWWLLFWPMRFHEGPSDNLVGRIPEILTESGFAPVSVAGHWAGFATFWVARKPATTETKEEKTP